VEGLLQEDERNPFLLEVKKLILHDAAGNDPIFLARTLNRHFPSLPFSLIQH
jgi:hypothetical protein